MSELTILCDVQACAIIYGKHDTQDEVWPSSAGVQRTYTKFKTMPSMEQTKKSLQGFNMEDLNDLGWMINHKVEEINRKMKKVNDELAQNEQSKPCSKNITATSDQRQNDEHAANSGITYGDDDPARPLATSADGGA
ncbi:hypothetical protein DVH24_009691 [Malus domestica]|uniref:MADS-box domain-containing protein n=1 Tax=Malus domestica TaxID=3750 RepID=A0A498JLN1_MALDO|nr:hypothetical protein DVH24_009691 [Malus domestica]